MKRIIIVLLSALAVFLVTLAVTDRYITSKAENTADTINITNIDHFSRSFNRYLSSSQATVQSFLAGEFSLHCDGKADHSGDYYYIKDQYRSSLLSSISMDMEGFLHSNPYFHRAVLLVDDQVSQPCGYKCNFAVIMAREDEKPTISNDYDFMNSASYNKVKDTHKMLWTLPSHRSPLNGKEVMLFVPILNQDGSFFGTFVVNIDLKVIHEIISSHLPYGKKNSEMIIYDSNKRVVASYPTVYEEFDSIPNLVSKKENVNISELGFSGDKGYSKYMGKTYLLYKRHLETPDWYVITACKQNAIYENANHIKWVTFATSAIGMTLMLICCLVVFYQTRKHLREKAIAQNELQMAARVQGSLLKPKEFCRDHLHLDAFLQPAREAGGDLYDYVERDGKLIFCIGDVSGKGMPAAMFMSQTISLFRYIVQHTDDPAEMMAKMNGVLAQDNPDMTFCTCFIGVLDGDKLTFCNAGHNPAVYVSNESTHFMKQKPNLPLGLMEGYKYQTEKITLPQGSQLVLYTDGITEAKNATHQQFGDQRLIDTVSNALTEKNNLRTAILDAVKDFVGKAPQSDDITLLILKSGSSNHQIE